MQPVSAVSITETAIRNLQEGFSELALIPEIQHRRHEAKIGRPFHSIPPHSTPARRATKPA